MKPSDISPPPEILPRLRLFLSIDLVGSTGFKQAPRYPLSHPDSEGGTLSSRSGPWLPEILSFYSEFSREYAQQWSVWLDQEKRSSQATTAPEFWKGNGDELLFTLELNHPRDIYRGIVPWVRAFSSFRSKLRERQKNLDVKSTAWLAGFPINNSEIVFPLAVNAEITGEPIQDPILAHYHLLHRWYSNQRAGLIKDYIGPSIDTGFRLSNFSTPRKFVISIDVALLLSGYNLSGEDKQFSIYFDGKEELKGVLGGRPYPILWIDLGSKDGLATAEDKLRQHMATKSEDVKRYCEAFLSENSGHLMRPFIWNCDDEEFSSVPPNYVEQIAALVRTLKGEEARRVDEVKGLAAEPTSENDGAKTPGVEKLISALSSSQTKRKPRKNLRKRP